MGRDHYRYIAYSGKYLIPLQFGMIMADFFDRFNLFDMLIRVGHAEKHQGDPVSTYHDI
jgi:hypothetical protein